MLSVYNFLKSRLSGNSLSSKSVSLVDAKSIKLVVEEDVEKSLSPGYEANEPASLSSASTIVINTADRLTDLSSSTNSEVGQPNESFLPAACFNGSVADFYTELEKQEPHFKQLYDAATAAGCKLKFIAKFEKEARGHATAKVGLQHIQPSSDFYHLYGKDNLVLFYTNRYPELPLVIKGAGAGADVTASGVFADIIRAARV
jgi:hypothetical protein